MDIEDLAQPESAPETDNPETPADAPAQEANQTADDQPQPSGDATEQAGADQAPEAQASDELEEAKKAERRRQSAKERVQAANRRKQAAEAALAESQRREQALKERLAAYETPPPVESDFATYEEFQAAQTAYQTKQVFKEERAHEAQEASQDVERAKEVATSADIEAFNVRQAEFAAEATDYFDVVANPALPFHGDLFAELQASEKGPQVAYYLAKNPAEAHRIAALGNPRAVARAVGAIEGRLTAPAPKRVSSAPPPVGSVVKGSGSDAGFNPDKATLDDVTAQLKRDGVI